MTKMFRIDITLPADDIEDATDQLADHFAALREDFYADAVDRPPVLDPPAHIEIRPVEEPHRHEWVYGWSTRDADPDTQVCRLCREVYPSRDRLCHCSCDADHYESMHPKAERQYPERAE